jgi:hypothetical protein
LRALFERVMGKVREREKRRRHENDAALRPNPAGASCSPVHILDELPIVVRRKGGSRVPKVQASRYSPPARPGTAVEAQPQQRRTLPEREAPLRLVRAYRRANEEAWRLV